MSKETLTVDEIKSRVGQNIGTSRWFTVDQKRIDGFADVTEDHQFIHIDVERAKKETPFGGTIAHGFLTLSLLAPMGYDALPTLSNRAMGINYGLDKVRFLNPVRAGSRVRAHYKLADVTQRSPKELLFKYEVTVEIEGQERPALIAESLGMAVLA
ncbi:MAG: MaoC family dehydratase [Xanthobacteraceae bacterium]|nr:MaoC family dehydratase [Xanthobacteraceae bacterium]MBX3535935.1 MaoC family dehydratase [Xanthobacteraceae bacterium]MBX3548851.1 MaoC family dehydratase [Xanthobacteraceae bacterium]MCW5674482.1 MaoC family dehydratase [Xanthobacteraceae bacterium]MCW5678799.1 MaoC family dehydratase [Xanthobacteraceae bacterium]